MNLLPSALQYLPEIADLPLILAGPILRRTEPDKVTVWLALKESRSLCLKIYATTNQGATIGQLVFQGQSNTVELGKHLHIAAITAISQDNRRLEPERIYAYSIYSCQADRTDIQPVNLLNNFQTDKYCLSYFAHQLPTFTLPPEDINQLKIVHGSCRKPHGGGIDTLSYLDYMIRGTADSATARPQQLFLTGDQIYGDDVADPLLWLIQGINQLLFGWSEELPLQSDTILSDDLIPGQRSEIARLEGGLTAMLKDSPEKAKSHLFSFGEYAAAYLLSWSPVLTPDRFPLGANLFSDSKQSRQWSKELTKLESFIQDLDKVRRALANIPVYTICDDHDVSDDWYLNREWCDRVLGKPLGKRVVQNGLLAYALFQAWGNTPEQFALGTAGAKLLQQAGLWLTSAGNDLAAKTECDRYLGIPLTESTTGLPQYALDEDTLVLTRDDEAISWHYSVSSNRHEVIVLDTRAWRGYPQGKNNSLEPPMLLCPQAFKQQLEIPLAQSKPEIEATLVILPTNLVALGIIDRIQQFELSRDRVFNSDVGDAWNFHTAAFAQLLLTLCQQRQRVIILSGDIHYSCAVRLTHWFHDSDATTVLVQLTSSAIKNSELSTRLAHTKLKSLLPEKKQRWLGWSQPLKTEKIANAWWNHKRITSEPRLPDWQYKIEWCRRQAAQPLPWQQPVGQKNDGNLWQKAIAILIFWLWRNPWLQEGSEVIGRNNLSLVKFRWSDRKMVIQETYWHSPWNRDGTVKSNYEVSLEPDALQPLNQWKRQSKQL